MNALIIATVVIAFLAITAIVFLRSTRDPNQENPKRRELRLANVRVIAAQRAMFDVEQVIARYRSTLDITESALVADVERVITEYKTKDMETTK